MVGEPVSACLDSDVGFVDLAGVVAVGVTALAVAGLAYLAIAEVASMADAGVASMADAGVASLADAGVASLAVAGVAFLAVAGVVSLADLAGGVTVGVASPAVAGVVSLADAGVASLADLADCVTFGVTPPAVAGVASLADAGVVYLTVAGVASLADSAKVVSSADIAGSVAVGVTFFAHPVGVFTEEMTVRDKRGTMDGSVYDCGDCRDGSLGYRHDEDPCYWGGFPCGTLLADPVGVITGEMTFRERCGVLDGSVYECDDFCDCSPDYCD